MPYCRIPDLRTDAVRITPSTRRCRYHRTETTAPAAWLAPEGFCPEAFHALFPTVFAAFSVPGSRLPHIRNGICPAGEIRVALSHRPFLHPAHLPGQLIRRAISLVYPCEVLRRRIFIEVTSSGKCPYSYTTGEQFEVNLGHRREICPAASHAVYPHVAHMIHAPDTKAPSPPLACPDHLAHVRLSVAGTDSSSTGNGSPCPHGSPGFMEIVDSGGSVHLSAGERIDIARQLETMGLPCISLLNTVAPYYRVLTLEGKLG